MVRRTRRKTSKIKTIKIRKSRKITKAETKKLIRLSKGKGNPNGLGGFIASLLILGVSFAVISAILRRNNNG